MPGSLHEERAQSFFGDCNYNNYLSLSTARIGNEKERTKTKATMQRRKFLLVLLLVLVILVTGTAGILKSELKKLGTTLPTNYVETTTTASSPAVRLAQQEKKKKVKSNLNIQTQTDPVTVCESDKKSFSDVINYFATKTPYLPKHVNDVTSPGCTAEGIWILSRHGTRYPGDDDILAMQNDLPALRTVIRDHPQEATLNTTELEAILNWAPYSKLNVSQESWLVDQGYRELREISNRFQERFPNLFPPIFDNDSYYFRGTVEQRAQESAKAFAGAIFGQSLPGVTIAPPIKGDPILHFYKNCEKWIKEVDENPAAKYESEKFLRSPVFQQALSTVGSRLGLGRNVTEAEILLMYKTCNFETAWKPWKVSPWCAVFEQEELETLEYQEDLEDYWMDSYAYPITYEQACTPVQDVVNTFNAKIARQDQNSHLNADDGNNTTSKRLTTVYFGHSGTILKLYARLGLFQDKENLTSDSYTEHTHESRQWLNSKIGKFASNIAFVLFRCSNESDSDASNNLSNSTVHVDPVYKIGTLVQEQPTALPACNGTWLCPYSQFVSSVADIVNTCNLTEICKVDDSSAVQPTQFSDLM